MDTAVNHTLGRDLGISGKWADVKSFQIVNDISAAIGSLGGRMINLEYGPHASLRTRIGKRQKTPL